MVMPMIDPGFRHYLNELYREDDRLRAEYAAWTAVREAAASPPVSESAGLGVLYRDYDGGASRAAAEAEPAQEDWSGWERWLDGHLALHRAEMIEGMAQLVCEFVRQNIDPLEQQLAELKAEVAELKARAALAHHL
jgi:hypothetical protein